MRVFKIVKLIIFLVICLVIMVPAWYNFLDFRQRVCTIEEFNAGKNNLVNHITISGNALFNYAYRYEELSNDTVYNVVYFIPMVDSLWNIDKPIKTILAFESGKMAFDEGFKEAVQKLDKEIDSLTKLKSNRLSFTGNNKMLEFPRFDSEVISNFKNSFQLKISSGLHLSKIAVNEHFSMLGFAFVTVLTIVLGFLLYYFSKPFFKQSNRSKAL